MNFTVFRGLDLEHFKIDSARVTRREGREATMDQTDMRGLITAIHLSVAGLPRSNAGDHHADATHS
jgi:hypothetical protein